MTPLDALIPQPHDERSLHAFAEIAQQFLATQPWCRQIKRGYLGYGIDGILGVFQFQIVSGDVDMSEYLWVIIGDIPPALFACDELSKPSTALQEYVDEMQLWTAAVKAGKSTADLIPVCYQDSTRLMEPTMEFAQMLESRLHFIQHKLIPDAKSQEA